MIDFEKFKILLNEIKEIVGNENNSLTRLVYGKALNCFFGRTQEKEDKEEDKEEDDSTMEFQILSEQGFISLISNEGVKIISFSNLKEIYWILKADGFKIVLFERDPQDED